MAYQPIANYGMIGNMHTVALAGKNGSIDWFCPRQFDDASIFARILDDNIGGYFQIHPDEEDITENGVDGVSGDEGTFNMCTFWLAEALARNGQLEAARLLFEKMPGYANHPGLYAEETGNRGEAPGNFPQAFTHLSLISAAYNLNRVLDDGKMP